RSRLPGVRGPGRGRGDPRRGRPPRPGRALPLARLRHGAGGRDHARHHGHPGRRRHHGRRHGPGDRPPVPPRERAQPVGAHHPQPLRRAAAHRKDPPVTHPDTLQTLLRFLDNKAPTVEEAVEVFTPMTIGEYDDVHIAALLATIRTRGETFADIAGAAKAFLNAGHPFPVAGEGVLDTAGTGGDGANTINITTGASLLAAAGGLKVVKHGNRSVSSRSGSADVLEALNIPLDLDPDRAV